MRRTQVTGISLFDSGFWGINYEGALRRDHNSASQEVGLDNVNMMLAARWS